jgi:membrane-bound inhibitor of C-type lysozyme
MASNFTGVGDFVTDSRTLAFIREQAVGIYAVGLKPSSTVHVYFDNKNVDAFARPASFDPTTSNPTIDSFNATGVQGSTLTTDSTGVIAIIFYIPPGTFFTGDRQVVISDATSVAALSSASTTTATTIFHAFNYPLETTDSSIVSPRPSDNPVSTTSNRGSGTTTNVDNNSRFDPMCQSFYIGTDMANGQDGVYLSYINVYFQAKDPVVGVSFDIRSMENGIPTTKIVPFSKVHLTSANVNISTDSSLATQIIFPSPVFLRSGYEYALSIIPDGASPNYVLWTAVVGSTDVLTGNPISKNWGQGVLFTSSTGTTWTPIQNEYLKFDIYSAQYTSSSGIAVLTNDDLEFFKIQNVTSAFTQGEWAYQVSANQSGTLSINTSSQIVTGTGTTFTTTLSSGQAVAVTNGSVSDVLFVNSIANNTQFTAKNIPDFTSASANYQLAPVGRIYYYDPNKAQLILKNSTANSTVYFTSNSNIIGAISNTQCAIQAIENKVVNRFQPQIYYTDPHGSYVALNVSGITSNYVSIGAKSYDLASTDTILGNEQVIASKTNEILYNSGNKSLTVNLNLNSNSSTISPIIDTQSTSFVIYKNKINKSTNRENTKSGEAWSKGISQTVTLAEGQDAEDITAYITAYRPVGTTISLYAKILNSADTDSFDAKDWTKLTLVSNSTKFSDSTNLTDYIEYQYTFPDSPPSYLLTGVLSTNVSSNTITGSGTKFQVDAPANSEIKIWSDSTQTNFQIARVTAVSSNTSLTIDQTAAFTSATAVYEFVTQPKTAFHNPQNQNIVRYYSTNGSAYDSYKTFAIKTVLSSNTTYQVPRVADLRVIAMSI